MQPMTNKQKGVVKILLDQIINGAKLAKIDVERARDSILALRLSTDRLLHVYEAHTGSDEPELPIPDIDEPGSHGSEHSPRRGISSRGGKAEGTEGT